ncbi:MFS transporter [Vannielia litorea]|uniref:Major Facilitator Superfamily protein n=1 Tax=Vannielia litorea TaxID=1217970 RepID=A0A1N6IKT4_9RHOB|nr:MFS transporter [Vannielia litorea]SIO32622.1 Major Facilitator Superfamily protein [Vannielia litorea]
MHERRIPEWLRHAPTPGVRGFAVLAGTEAVARGMLISVFPLAMYTALGDARLVSAVYFAIGVASLLTGLLVPSVIRFIPRRFVYATGCLMFAAGALTAATGVPLAVCAGLALVTCATVTCFVCFNAYVLDYIARVELGQLETSRLFYSALGWTVGPVAGVTLREVWAPAPFIVSACAALGMLAVFLVMRLGNGRLITRSRGPEANPFGYLARFLGQPRLVAGWLFAVIRSCGWWVYVVYLPIFAVEAGLGPRLGGFALSASNAALFLAPLMLRYMQRRSVRRTVRTGFAMAGLLFCLAGAVQALPHAAVLCLLAGACFLILLDVSAGLPFLLAVKPSERTEMSAIYASFRDVSGILTPGAAWLVLLAAPVAGVFWAGGAALLGAWALAGQLHPRLGAARVGPQGAVAEAG